jgi:hypothetical protein
MPEPEGSEPKPAVKTGISWPQSTLWLGITLILAVTILLVLRTCTNAPREVADATGRAIEKAGKAVATVLSAFNSGKVTTEFISYASSIQPTHRLQFATLKQMEIFTRTDEATTAFGYFPLPEVIVEARAPVEFTYYLDLNAPWRLVLEDNVIYVLAPKVQFNLPSVDVSAIRYEVRKGSVFRSTAESLEGLKQSITLLSRQKALENVNLVRETGRRQTEEFVEKWLSRQFSDGKSYPVKVYFTGERLPPPLQQPPSPLSPPPEVIVPKP